MPGYLSWNDALAGHYFRPEAAGQPIWLYVTDDVIGELGSQRSSTGVPDFVSAVKIGPPWCTANGLCQRALQAFEGWRNRGLDYPPYIGYLGLFVLAAGLEGDFARHAYYPRLRVLLGEVGDGALPSFARMLELWDDLERWSTQDKRGSLGLFEARIVGGHIHVGLPIAQTILSEDERQALPKMFADAGFDPTSPPPDDALARMLRAQIVGVLRPRTRELVRTRRDPESYAVLIDTVGDELARWDGSYQDEAEDGRPGRDRKLAGVRLCVEFDRVSGRLGSSMRCRLPGDFPDHELSLTSPGLPSMTCYDSGLPGWSSALEIADTHDAVDAASIDWRQGVAFKEETLGWRLSLPSRRVRILTSGQADGLPGLVEVQQVPRAQAIYLLYQESDWIRLMDWTQHECREFQILPVRNGIRDGWQLGSCSEVTGDSLVRSAFPELALSERVRIGLVGGVRSPGGSGYFPFAPPTLSLEGGTGTESLRCNGRELVQAGSARRYAVPDDFPVESRLAFEAVRDGQPVKRLSIYLTGQFEWRRTNPAAVSNGRGEPWAGDSVGAAGALTVGERPRTDMFEKSLILAPGIDRRAPRIFFIGSSPGQVYTWPKEGGSTEWRPVWAVPMGRHGHAVYSGEDIAAARPDVDHQNSRPDDIQLWKQVLWHWRRRIKPPTEPPLRALWRSYVEVAGRV
jgi:hypothetical protein